MPKVSVVLTAPAGACFNEEVAEDLLGQEFPMLQDGVPLCVGRIVAAELESPLSIRATVSASRVPEGHEGMTPELLIEAVPEDDAEASFRYWSREEG